MRATLNEDEDKEEGENYQPYYRVKVSFYDITEITSGYLNVLGARPYTFPMDLAL